jgi:uncharacterized protein YerC
MTLEAADISARLPLALIRRDGGTQPRDHVSSAVATAYAEDMRDGAAFPPVIVYFDGAAYWLADGFHRVMAVELIGGHEIDAEVRQGTRRDAILFSVGANAQHGYRRSNDDKRRVVRMLLDDPEWAAWSDREIARRCYVGADMVGRMRPSPSVGERQMSAGITRKVVRGGTTFEMSVAAINGARPSVPHGEDGIIKNTRALSRIEFQGLIAMREKLVRDDLTYLAKLKHAAAETALIWDSRPDWSWGQVEDAYGKGAKKPSDTPPQIDDLKVRKKAQALFRAGASVREISLKTGLSHAVSARAANRWRRDLLRADARCDCGRPLRHFGRCPHNGRTALGKRWELRIEQMIMAGKTVREIADELSISVATVLKRAAEPRRKLFASGVNLEDSDA